MPPRLRTALAVVVASVSLAACAPAPTGPAAPIALEQFDGAPAFDASAARQTVVDFVDAYAASPTQGARPLVDLIAGNELAEWVRWLDVQHGEFTGTISANADVRDVEFIGTLEAARASGAQVGLSATVTFSYAPQDADAFERARILDGPVTLLRTDAGGYRVVDLLRDGVPMTDGIQVFRNERRTEDGVTVTLDSLFRFAPNWQFNVVVDNPSGSLLELDPDASGLFVDTGASADREAGATTGSILAVAPGSQVDGILAYPSQDEATGRTLILTYRDGERILRFDFPLEDLVEVVPPPANGITGATGPVGATA